jgi:DNA mismatch repair protein MutS2
LAEEWRRRQTRKLEELERRCETALERFEAQAREAIERLLRDAEPKRAAAAMRRLSAVKRELGAEIEVTLGKAREEATGAASATPAAQIREGTSVRLRSWPGPARVRRLLPHEEIEVEAGAVRLRVPASDVVEVLPEPGPPHVSAGISFHPAAGRESREKAEIRVIGEHAEEARARVEKFLDDAALAGLRRVRIVHGHGMGVLRATIAGLLTESPHVARFYFADPLEGGAGVTIVELRGGDEPQ